MVNKKKYDYENPRVLISTRLKTKKQLIDKYPEHNTIHKKLEALLNGHQNIKD